MWRTSYPGGCGVKVPTRRRRTAMWLPGSLPREFVSRRSTNSIRANEYRRFELRRLCHFAAPAGLQQCQHSGS